MAEAHFSSMEHLSSYMRPPALKGLNFMAQGGQLGALVSLVALAALMMMGTTGAVLTAVVTVGCISALAFCVAHVALKYFGFNVLFNDVYKTDWVHKTDVVPYGEYQVDLHFEADFITRPGKLYIENRKFADKKEMVDRLHTFCKDGETLRFATAIIAQTGFADSVYYSHMKFSPPITSRDGKWFCKIGLDKRGYMHVYHQQVIVVHTLRKNLLVSQMRTFDPSTITAKGAPYTLSLSLAEI